MPRVDFPWGLERGVGHRHNLFQNCEGCSSFLQRQCLQSGNLYEGHLTNALKTYSWFCLCLCSLPGNFPAQLSQIAENKLSLAYPHPAGYQFFLKPKLLLSLDLHAYCSILREAPNPHQNSRGGCST